MAYHPPTRPSPLILGSTFLPPSRSEDNKIDAYNGTRWTTIQQTSNETNLDWMKVMGPSYAWSSMRFVTNRPNVPWYFALQLANGKKVGNKVSTGPCQMVASCCCVSCCGCRAGEVRAEQDDRVLLVHCALLPCCPAAHQGAALPLHLGICFTP